MTRAPLSRWATLPLAERPKERMGIFVPQELGGSVNVVAVGKEVGCLITINDLEGLNLGDIKGTVILPGRTLAHEMDIKQVLTRDGVDRLIRRGPDRLTVDGEMSISMSKHEVLDVEIEAFSELIEQINALGV